MTLVIFTWGNPSRGDDGVGPWFANWLSRQQKPAFLLCEDFQLQVEHVLDCARGNLLLFIDAYQNNSSQFQFQEVTSRNDMAHTSHALVPAELLGYYRRVFKQAPAPAFQLTIAGSAFELGQSMSAATEAQCELAAEFLKPLQLQADADCWRALCKPAPELRHA